MRTKKTMKKALSWLLTLAMILSMVPGMAFAEGEDAEESCVAVIDGTEYATFDEAMAAASGMTGDVTVEIYDKVTLNSALSGSYDSIEFAGMDTDAEIYLDVQGYITATDKKVAFGYLTLSKSEGGFITNAGFMNVAFGIYDVTEVSYTNCTFTNGAYASSGEVTFTGCTFYRSHDKYGLWAYGDVNCTVDGCTFADYRGIKMYAEGAAKTVDLTVKNTDFLAVTDKPAIVLTYGESVTLEGNTYSSTGVLELEDNGSSNGTKITSTDAVTCVSDAYPDGCGVLVGDQIYRTVADAAAVAERGDTVTLLHNSTETVALPEGVTLDKNGYTADGVTEAGSATTEITTINSVADLQVFADAVNGGNTYEGVTVTLAADLILSGEWTPIGNGTRSSKTYTGNAFKGTFDGGDYTISGLTITSTTGDDAAVGLFGVVDGGTVKNLKLDGVNINVASSDLAGAAIGLMVNNATADNITVSGSVVGNDGVGGIVGRLIISGTISNCTNNASVTSAYGGIGGIVGKAYYEDGSNTDLFANITNCTNNGTVTAPMYVGGIVGLARANVTDCVNNGAVVGGTQTGGIIGQLIAAGTVSGNENKAEISGKNHMGGIIGDYSQSNAYTYNDVTIANNINRGELAATEQCAAIMGCNNIDGFTDMTASGNVSYYYVDGLELFGNPEDMVIDDTNKFVTYVAYIGEQGYETLAAAIAAAKPGDEIKILTAGTYKVPAGKDLTITGAVDGVVFDDIGACNMGGADVTFNNVTFDYYPNVDYTGLQHSGDLEYNNCTFNGQVFLYGQSETFNNCIFNQNSANAYNVWTYGAQEVKFNKCTFNSAGKSVLVYNEGACATDLTVQETGFNASQPVEGKAAIEIDTSLMPSGTEIVVDNDSSATGFAAGSVSGSTLWNDKKADNSKVNGGTTSTVIVGGVTVKKAAVTGLSGSGTAEDPFLINDLEDLIWFQEKVDELATDGSTQFAGKYFKLTADIDLAGINWNPIGTMSGDHGSFKGVFDGAGHTIFNLNCQQAGNGLGLFARTAGNAEIKNLNLHNVTVKSTDNSNYVGGVVGNSYASTKITNVHVTGTVDISGRGYIGGISGHGYVVMDNVSVVGTGTVYSTFWCAGGILGYAGEGATNIMNAHVEGITITSAAGGLGAIVGMAEDNNGTQPISGSNLSAKNVEIKTYTGAYGDAYANYALGYLYGGNPTSKLTGTNIVENVKVETSTGEEPEVSDAVASIGNSIYFDLQTALDAAAAGTGNVTVKILRDVNLTGVDWNPVTVSASGYPLVTVNGNNKTITGLNDMLFAGTWAGGSGLIINDLTIKDSAIVNDKDDAKGTVGVGAFIGYPQASATITLNNCHLVDSSVEGGHWTGGLIGMAGGYNGNDGPVFMNLTITGCSVTGSTITGKGSCGGVIGHGSCAAWTNVVIEDTTVSDNTVTSTGSSNNKAGAVMGTIGAAGQPTTANGETKTGGASVAATVSGNTVKSGGTTIKTIYGRQGTATGMLEIAGGTYDNYPIEENVAYAAPAEGYKIVKNENDTYGLVENVTYVSTKAQLDAALAAAQPGETIRLTADIDYTGAYALVINKQITLDLGGRTLTTNSTYQGGIHLKGNCTLKNGTLVHKGAVAAIKAWNVTALEKLVIEATKTDAKNPIGGIVLQSSATTRVDSIKNVTIQGEGLTNGIETYNCGDAAQDVIGSMENVTIDAKGTGMLISAPCGTATNCSIKGGTNGIEIWIKGTYSASLALVNSKVEGGVFAHDEFSSNPDITNNGTLSLTVDSDTTGAEEADVTLTLARAEKVEGVLEDVKKNAQAKVNNTYHATLDAAMEAAVAGDTVTILAGEYTTNLNVNKAITVVGETNAEGGNLVKINGGIDITADGASVKNLTASDPDNGGYNCTLYINAKDVLVEGCEITDYNATRYCETDGKVTIKDCVLTATGSWAIHFDGKTGGEIVVDNCEVNGWIAFAGSLNKVTLKDSTFTKGNYSGGRTYNKDVVIDGCTFETGYKFDLASDEAKVVVTNSKMSDGSEIVNLFNKEDAVSSTITIDNQKLTYVAKIGSVYYASLEDALAAVADWTTIKLVANATLDYNAREAYGRDSTTDIIIDGQGYTLTLNQKDSDWSSIGMKNANGKLTLKNMTIEKTGYGDTSGAWNTHAIIFTSNVEMTDVTVNNSMAVQAGATLNNVTINEANGYYGLWVNGNGQTVTVNGGEINATNGGRGIKIADEYIDAPEQVTLNVTGTKFNTAKKAAVLVSSTAGAAITASNVDITNVAEDSVNFAWVDEDRAANYGEVEVTGGTVGQESVEDFLIVVKNGDKIVSYFKTLAEALANAQNGETVELIWTEGAAPIAMNGYVSGKTVTITGTAQVDWEKGFLFVGRTNDGTTAGDATLIFKDAKLTTAQGGDHGIHVSGAEKGSATKANGTVQFIDSTVNLSYLINKGTMTLNNSTLTVKSGFSIGGRPASETETGEDATATINLTNGSKVIVDNHNGMGLGYEAIGVMNIDDTSSFETTQSFLVTAKGTMNIAGTANIAGTLTNNGSIVLTDADATLTSSECGNVTTNVTGNYEVKYVDGKYSVEEKAEEPVGTIAAKSATLLYEDMIQIRYKFAVTGENIANYGMLVFDSAEDAATLDVTKAKQNKILEVYADGCYGYTDGIAAKNMGDSQFVVGYIEQPDGTYVYADMIEYSPKKYASNMVKKSTTSAETKLLCNALMQYGAAAQLNFNYKTNDLMNVGFDAVTYNADVLGNSVFSVDTTETNGFTTKSATLLFEGAITYRIKYEANNALSGKTLYAEYTTADATETVEMEQYGNECYAYIAGIAAKDMDAAVKVKPYYLEDSGNKVYGAELIYSGYEYSRRTINNGTGTEESKALAKAFAMYVYAADAAITK